MSDGFATHIVQISNGAVKTLDDLGIGSTSSNKLTLSKALAPGSFDHTSSPPTGGVITSSVDGLPYWVTSGGTVYGMTLDPDLVALAAVTGTNTIYYRSASNTWTAVTIGSGLSFSGGTLSSTGSTVAWGAITGTLSSQTDLNSALSGKQPLDADLTALAGLTSAANKLPYFTGSGTASLTDFTAYARTLLENADELTMHSALGLVIGANVQAHSLLLSSLSSLSTTSNTLPYFSSTNNAALTTLTTFARSILDDADAAAARVTLGVEIGVNVQAYDADLTSLAGATGTNTLYYRSAANTWSAVTIGGGLTFSGGTLNAAGGSATWGAIVGTVSDQTDLQAELDAKQDSNANLTAISGLTSASNSIGYFTGSGTASLATFTAAARNLVDDADATAMRATLGLVIGTDVQAYDADLAALAAVSGTNTIYYRSAAATWSAVTIGAALTFSGGTLNAAGGAATWGAIVGTLSSQTDLNSALNGKQPLDGDLTALAALSGTNTIYYRSAADTWTAVTIGAGLAFSSGTLSVSGGGTGDMLGVGSSVDSEMMLFDGTTGKQAKRATGTGISIVTSGVFSTITQPSGAVVGTTATQTLTNKTLTAPIIATISNTGTITLPTSTDTLVGRATTDTLTNKTLTAPVISTIVNTGTLTLPTSTDTLVGRATTDTLTNKTLTSPVIATITNTGTITLPTATTTLVGRATTDTLQNKRIQPPVETITSSSTLTPNLANGKCFEVTALATNATIGAPTGTPTNFETLLIRIKDNGTARTLSWNAIFRVIGKTLPTTTVLSKLVYILAVYNSNDTKWDVLEVGQE